MELVAKAPTRVDLAGGTLDIYPLYIFEDGGITVNAAIEVFTYVRIRVRDDGFVTISSEDTGDRMEAPSVEELDPNGPLPLLARIVRFYLRGKGMGIDLRTSSDAPPGSGLGGSSSLLVSLSSALNHLTGGRYTPQEIIDIGANLEAQTIRIPTGKQDYFPAMYGGVNAIWFDVDGSRIEPLIEGEDLLRDLESRIILSYTGISRASAKTNWRMVRNYIDGREETIRNMRMIKDLALRMRDSLKRADFDSFGRLVGEEWRCRRGLARGVSNRRIERIMAAASSHGAIASKICGAGGGGCMITVVPPDKRKEVEMAMEMAGARIMDFRIARSGVEVREEG